MSMILKGNSGINFKVDTVDDLLTLEGSEGEVVIVSDENRGGTFVYRSAEASTNNGGTVFNGWCRQYDGAVNVKWFGAKGDGITDDTVAIQSAIDNINVHTIDRFSLSNGKDSRVGTATRKKLLIPSGKYIVSDELNLPGDIEVVGEKAYIKTESLVNSIFTTETINTEISGIIFDGGAIHIKIYSTTRTESGFVHIHNCQFRFANERVVKVDRSGIAPSSGFPMTLQINNCKSYGSPFLESYTNGTFVSDCWIAWDVSADNHSGGHLFIGYDKLHLQNILEVPFGTNSSAYSRFYCSADDSLYLSAIGCRFGGEATNTPLIDHSGTGGYSFKDCAFFGFAEMYWAKFNSIPSYLSITEPQHTDGESFTNSWGMWFNSNTITSASDIPDACKFDLDLGTKNIGAYIKAYTSDSSINGGGILDFIPSDDAILDSDKTLKNYDVLDGITFWVSTHYDTSNRSNASAFSGTKIIQGKQLGYSNFSGRGYFSVGFKDFTPSGGAGIYTFSCLIECTSEIVCRFTPDKNGIGDTVKTYKTLRPGINKFRASFYHDGISNTKPEILCTGDTGDVLTIGLFNFNKGSMAGKWTPPRADLLELTNKQFYSNSVPVDGRFELGDIIYNASPSASGNVGWICTASGTPGTWKSFGTIEA